MEGSDHDGLEQPSLAIGIVGDESLHGRNVLGLHDEKRTVHGLGTPLPLPIIEAAAKLCQATVASWLPKN